MTGHRIVYVANGVEIVLDVPWPTGVDMIPPPSIPFMREGRSIVFSYDGSEDE